SFLSIRTRTGSFQMSVAAIGRYRCGMQDWAGRRAPRREAKSGSVSRLSKPAAQPCRAQTDAQRPGGEQYLAQEQCECADEAQHGDDEQDRDHEPQSKVE